MGRGGQTSQGKESHLAVQLAVIQALLLDKSIMLVLEIIVVLELLLGENFEEFRVDCVGIAEGLDGGKGGKIVEVEMGVGKEGSS